MVMGQNPGKISTNYLIFLCIGLANQTDLWQCINNMCTAWQKAMWWVPTRGDCWRILTTAIKGWWDEGDNIILFMDMNENVWLPWLCIFSKLGLIEVLSDLHGDQAPAAHNRGKFYFLNHLCAVAKGGCLAFGEGIPSHHWGLWLDLPAYCTCLAEQTQLWSPAAWQLQCKDHSVEEHYNAILFKQLHTKGIFKQALHLQQFIKGTYMKCSKWKAYKYIDQTVTAAKLSAKCQYQKCKMGNVPWCLHLTNAIQQVLYWKEVLSKKKGSHIGTSVLHQQAKKAGLIHKLQNISDQNWNCS